MNRLHGKTALVTGGASGIGAAIASHLRLEGADVTLTDIDAAAGVARAKELGCRFIQHDVTDPMQWSAVIQDIEREQVSLHVVVNNAGIEGPFEFADVESTEPADWQAIHRVNVQGTFLGCRAAMPALRRSGGGAIINISSTAALAATPEFAAYGASKAAVRHLTMSVALHCARDGSRVRCNSVHPGIVRTPMLERICQSIAKRRGTTQEEVLEQFRASIPQGEFQEVEDIADSVLFLASDQAKHITGLAMVVDGGCTLGLRRWD
jgi:3(or 17)beta-hydroxysteroid dehydrogenase